MDEHGIECDWDESNVDHVARHQIRPYEAEQVIFNHPLDLGMEIVEGEERRHFARTYPGDSEHMA